MSSTTLFQSTEIARARKELANSSLDFQKKCGKVYLFLHAFLIRNVLSKNVAEIRANRAHAKFSNYILNKHSLRFAEPALKPA